MSHVRVRGGEKSQPEPGGSGVPYQHSYWGVNSVTASFAQVHGSPWHVSHRIGFAWACFALEYFALIYLIHYMKRK